MSSFIRRVCSGFEVLPKSRPGGPGIFRGWAHAGGGADEPFKSDIGALLWPDLIVVSTPILHFRARVVKAHEPGDVETLGPKSPIEGFDEGVIRGLAGAWRSRA
jgi:hypothetical protein